ncbi:MAG: bifunctional 2-C-methyl-D-erythritol 4-phosphate cytidylyltransferase/2-C-methyl-D-erythritol 2,4-cyclodiphosphate synthase [Sphingorhabdus sp.]
MSSPIRTIALIVAAGSGSRTGGDIPKQFRMVRGHPMVRHSYATLSSHPMISEVYVAIGAGQDDQLRACLAGLNEPRIVLGGATRRQSVWNGLRAIKRDGGADRILIHDAARPFLPTAMISTLLATLDEGPGAVPGVAIVDSLARGKSVLESTVDREDLWRIQTPQAFDFTAIYTAHEGWNGAEPSDDARMLMALGQQVRIVDGDERLGKFTFASDFGDNELMPQMRAGSGFDVHRLVIGKELWLCGIKVPHDKGLSGHSDADVAMHALTDAILGAFALGDIGDHFPPSDEKWRGAPSSIFLAHAMQLANSRGYRLANADVTIICEAPKIAVHKLAMRMRLAQIMEVDIGQISVKATTTEMLGFTGRGEGIAAQASASFEKSQS